MKKVDFMKWGTLLGVSILGIWLIGSMFGLFNNFLGWDSRNSEGIWKVVALIGLGFTAWRLYDLIVTPREKVTYPVILVLILLVLSVASATGFKGTAGDIKQRITWMNLDGKVVDKDVLFNCYDGFYHFSSNPELKAYVEEYNELPGVNHWARHILDGKTPPSTAPRANENFQWHTGAYEMKIPKDCGR